MIKTRFDNSHFMKYFLSPVSDTVNVKIHWVPFDAYVTTATLSKQWALQNTAIVKISKKVHVYKF